MLKMHYVIHNVIGHTMIAEYTGMMMALILGKYQIISTLNEN